MFTLLVHRAKAWMLTPARSNSVLNTTLAALWGMHLGFMVLLGNLMWSFPVLVMSVVFCYVHLRTRRAQLAMIAHDTHARMLATTGVIAMHTLLDEGVIDNVEATYIPTFINPLVPEMPSHKGHLFSYTFQGERHFDALDQDARLIHLFAWARAIAVDDAFPTFWARRAYALTHTTLNVVTLPVVSAHDRLKAAAMIHASPTAKPPLQA